VAEIKVYGASWCPDCRRAKRFLGDQRVPFEWHVRSGSTKQLASAVGEGAGAAIAIRQYLENKDRN
jgi:glutaredoxin